MSASTCKIHVHAVYDTIQVHKDEECGGRQQLAVKVPAGGDSLKRQPSAMWTLSFLGSSSAVKAVLCRRHPELFRSE